METGQGYGTSIGGCNRLCPLLWMVVRSQTYYPESKFGRGPRPLDRRVVGWSCLCLGYKRGVCFGVPS